MELDLDQAMAVLQRTPAALRSLLAGLPDVWCRANEGADTWSPYDIVGHLIDGEETDWIARTRIILAQGANRRFAPFDRFAHLRRNQGRPLAELLDEFERKRAENLEILRGFSITPAMLELEGEHPEFGPVTLKQLLATWVAHDLTHLSQVTRVIIMSGRGWQRRIARPSSALGGPPCWAPGSQGPAVCPVARHSPSPSGI